MSAIFENLINGNLTEAQKQAKRAGSWQKLCLFAQDELGWSRRKAELAARFLKGQPGVWQLYCDAE